MIWRDEFSAFLIGRKPRICSDKDFSGMITESVDRDRVIVQCFMNLVKSQIKSNLNLNLKIISAPPDNRRCHIGSIYEQSPKEQDCETLENVIKFLFMPQFCSIAL